MPAEVLIGKWIQHGSEVFADDTCKLIEEMVERFNRVASRDNGWIVLFEDPKTVSLWELSYPNSELHGGGPPKLTRISSIEAAELYPERGNRRNDGTT